jgi:hypothetical protein
MNGRVDGDANERHQQLPLVLAVLRSSSSMAGMRRRSRTAAAARLGFGGNAWSSRVRGFQGRGGATRGGGLYRDREAP